MTATLWSDARNQEFENVTLEFKKNNDPNFQIELKTGLELMANDVDKLKVKVAQGTPELIIDFGDSNIPYSSRSVVNTHRKMLEKADEE